MPMTCQLYFIELKGTTETGNKSYLMFILNRRESNGLKIQPDVHKIDINEHIFPILNVIMQRVSCLAGFEIYSIGGILEKLHEYLYGI